MKIKKRLDVLLTERLYADSRSKAQAIIMSGNVYVNGQKADKPGVSYEETVDIEVRGAVCPYVSRGGLKLEKAVEKHGLSFENMVCMDIGASTGGFTDCMLQNGAAKVYAVDVGHGQLAWKLRNDERVVCMEKTNFRYMVRDDIQDDLDFASVDVSFISLKKILPPAYDLLKPGGRMVCLIKPQFETTKEKVGKKGVVREPSIHKEVIETVLTAIEEIGFEILDLDYSPIRGPEGNIEYLAYIRKPFTETESSIASKAEETEVTYETVSALTEEWQKRINEIVAKSHETL